MYLIEVKGKADVYQKMLQELEVKEELIKKLETMKTDLPCERSGM